DLDLKRAPRPDDTNLYFLRRHGWFRMPIPKHLGGEAAPKVEYYLMTTETHRLADVAVSLTIQVNSSLGTTPVLLARDKDLPRAQKELGTFTGDLALQAEIRERLQKLLEASRAGDTRGAAQASAELRQRLDEAVLSRP